MKIKMIVITLLLSMGSLLNAGIHGEWGYSGDGDPAHWGDLKAEFFMCKDGKNQSPVDIQRSEALHAIGLEED